MEVPRLGDESELQLTAYNTIMATPEPKTVGDNAVTLAWDAIQSISQTDCLTIISRTRPQNRQLFMNCYIALTVA